MAVAFNSVRTLELIGWDLDDYKFRPSSFDYKKQDMARDLISERPPVPSTGVLCHEETLLLGESFELQRARPDLHAEMSGLEWSLGVVDLRGLLAFQRRLSFHPGSPVVNVPCPCDWDGLMRIAFAPPHPVACEVTHDAGNGAVVIRSSNPNLHLRVTGDPATPIAVHAGSPFFEVAEYAGRWFLRDGYHRAYALLRAGVFHIPAVIVRARTLAELGAVPPQFFPERILLSEHPPSVSDFLDDRLIVEYERPPTVTTLRICMQESIEPAISN